MNKTTRKTIFLILFLVANCSLFSQISYLGKISQHEDGVYGLPGASCMAYSIDKNFIYVGSQYSVAVFRYDQSTGSTLFIEAYRYANDGHAGIDGPACITISPDNRYLYVSSSWLDCVSLYKRNIATGTLELLHIYYDTDEGMDGLGGASEMGISNDGSFLYIASYSDKETSTFRIDQSTGYLTHLQSLGGLSWPEALKLSRDGRFVYVASNMDDKIAVYEVNPGNGMLSLTQTVTQEVFSCYFIDISYDDRFVYVAGWSSLSVYSRDILTGKLTLHTEFNNNEGGVSGLTATYSLTVAPDDRNIYAISTGDLSFVTFSRQLSDDEFRFTGSLPFADTIDYSNLGYSTSAMICDNNYVFGASYWECGVHIAKRNQPDGNLTYERMIRDGDNSVIDGLWNPRGICADEQQKMVFVSSDADGISVFQRNDTTGKLIFKNFADNSNQNSTMLLHTERSVISKDGNYLYTLCNWENDGIAIFRVDRNSYNLTLVDSVESDVFGLIQTPVDLAFSPSGEHLYVVSTLNQSGIVQFGYNPVNGSLQFLNNFKFENTGQYFDNITVSKNGNYVFLWNTNDGTIRMLGREKTTGGLTLLSTFDSHSIPDLWLYELTDIALSNDLKNLYASYDYSNTLVTFSIDTVNHNLNVLQMLDYETTGINGLKRIQQIAVRNDGTFVYTSSESNNSLGLYFRDQRDGRLTFLKDYTEPENDFNGLDRINGISIPFNDRNLYLISSVEEAVASYSIDLYLGPDRVICRNDSALLDAGKGYVSYLWSTNETTQRIYVKEEGYYHVKTTDEFGFVDYDTVYIKLSTPVVYLGPDIEACVGEPVTLNSPFTENIWSTGQTSPSISVNHTGTYSVIITDPYQCRATDSVKVLFHPLPIVDLGNDVTIMLNQSMTFSAKGGADYGYKWYDGSTGPSVTIQEDSFTDNPLKIWVEVTTGFGCSNSDFVWVSLDTLNYYDGPADIKVWPVPTAKELTVESSLLISRIDCYMVSGKHLFTLLPASRFITFTVEHLSRGPYYLRIILTNGEKRTFKFVKM